MLGNPAGNRTDRPLLRERLCQPVDLAGLAVFRILFGTVMLWEIGRFAGYGWIRSYYIDPPLHFTYPGFWWIKPLPADGMVVFFGTMGVLALAIMLGFAYRLSIVLFTVGFGYWFLLEKARYQNHFYLLALLCLILCTIPANGMWSIDARVKPSLRRDTVPAWMLWLVRFQIAVPFFFGGIAKLIPDWLRGEPMRQWLADMADVPFIGGVVAHDGAPWIFSYGGIVFDLALAPLLLWKSSRPWAYAVNVAFHLTNACLFHIGIFPWFLIGATTIFFSPDWPRRISRRFASALRVAADHQPPATVRPDSTGPLRPAAAGALLIYVLLQCLIPFVHYAYPGPSIWTYEGEYFAWHMRLGDKISGIRFYVIDPVTGARTAHDPNAELPRWQADALSVNPEMIRQYAHWLADRVEESGAPRPIVRVYVMNSLNGRKPQRLIDPRVDLAAVPFAIHPADWILPLQDPLPGDWRPAVARQ